MKSVALKLPKPLAFYPTKISSEKRLLALIEDLRPRKLDQELIRLGPTTDGGYMVAANLDGITDCFSPGVDVNSKFEKACADLGMNVFMADASVDGPAEAHELFHFDKKFIGSYTKDEFVSINEWISSKAATTGKGDWLLQMDIEGFEYETIYSLSEELQSKFRLMVIEFHRLEALFSELGFDFFERAFRKILSTHDCIHIHPNNVADSTRCHGFEIPWFAEFTFLRKDFVTGNNLVPELPHPLDCRCDPDRPELYLDPIWFGNQPTRK